MSENTKAYFGLPAKVVYCKKCVMSNQRPSSYPEFRHTVNRITPTLHIGEDGVCDACRYAERKEDIDPLANHFLKIHASKNDEPVKQLRSADLAKLMQYDWPGNVRELENIIERGILLGDGKEFRFPTLGLSLPKDMGGHTLRDNERRHILWALEQTRWKVRGKGGAAALLEIHPSTLAFRMKKLGIKRPTATY